MSSADEEAFQKSLQKNEMQVDMAFLNQLYATIHYLYPTSKKNNDTTKKLVEQQSTVNNIGNGNYKL